MNALKNMRNKPSQDRSTDTVEVILEATTQVLDSPRDAPVTTNHIAQHAGVSIGSLYRYFKNKQGILALIVQREAARQESCINAMIINWSGDDGDTLIQQIALSAVNSFHGRRWVRRSLYKHLSEKDRFARQLHAMRYRILLRVEERLLAQHPHLYRALNDDERHAMLGAWAGTINAVMMYSPDDFEAGAVAQQLTDLVNGYLLKCDRDQD